MRTKKDNNYTITVFTKENQFLIKLEFVHNLYKTSQWLSSSQNFKNWYYFNVYDRRTKQFLKRIYKNEFIPPFL